MMAKKFPTDSDYANSNKNLEAEDYEVDYAITHTCPLYQVRTLGCYHVAREEEPLQNYFQWVCDKLNQTNEMLADGSGDKKADLSNTGISVTGTPTGTKTGLSLCTWKNCPKSAGQFTWM